MSFSTIAFGIIVLFFLWRGYQKGFVGSLTRLFSWLIAYPAAIVFTKPVSNMLSSHSTLDGLIVYFIAGGSVFMLVSFLAAQLFKLFTRSSKDKNPQTTRSRVGGAVIGICAGGFVGLLVGYAILFVQKPAATVPASSSTITATTNESKPAINKAAPESAVINAYVKPQSVEPEKVITTTTPQPQPTLIESSAKKLAGAIASTAVEAALDDPAATEFAREFAENPQEMMEHVSEISNNGEISKLFADPDIQSMLNSGDIDNLLVNEKFQDVMANKHMQGLLANIHDETTGKTSHQITAETMMLAWERMSAMKNNKRVEAILADPEFRDQITSSNKLALLMNPKMKELTEILFSKQEHETIAGDNSAENLLENSSVSKDSTTLQNSLASKHSENPEKPEIKSDTPIYRWVDDKGVVHFSDQQHGNR